MTRPSPRIEIAHEALKQAILERALQPGTKLPEDEIGAHFSMSRTLVRAVLARLQAEGLVDARPKRTATVALPTLAEARDVFEVRRTLEAEVVRLVIKRWKPAFGAELEGLVREEDAARERGEEHVWGRLAGEFHIRLAKLSGNALIAKYMAELVTRCSLILAVFGRPHLHDGGADEHAEIIAALRSGDAERAVAIMDHHMGEVESRAITGNEDDNRPALGDVLARYAGAISARDSAVPLIRKARGK
ncbi:GntR family transcriptional regulator [Devosia sp. SL43]|uniref:GntR family transcriptional regulator n=1 Tax=Devosia sp. SL43 TaxID=2806348 RepID=UPI001F2DC69E|nr:GntR family transcriptional regulator [Devosia sp. SL43]UJW85705.1 GntR family transcriptional regulator [Devosia sp. SL43]